MNPFLPIREDARGGCVVSSRCCGFMAETSCRADAEIMEWAFAQMTGQAARCGNCGKFRSEGVFHARDSDDGSAAGAGRG